ncbi:M50 family metallopeptidase [Alteribacter populi]|uniref:M50 family metallopeptidase n=1 Tax=Alteribacter populi TaxID=2011011 RepID=UPI0012FF8A34|nr:M50 family metallopeptidase [Alteribacter populi]
MGDLTHYFILFLIVIILSHFPIIGPYMKLFNTMIHESLGHALIARITGGRVVSIRLFQNTGGLAIFQHHWIGQVLTIFSGYPLASLMSVVYIYALSLGYYFYIGIALFVLLSYILIFWVRNIVGWVWVLSVMVGIGSLYRFADPYHFELAITIIGLATLIQALSSSWVVFILSLKDSKNAGDASLLAKSTFIPAPVWGMIFLLQAVFFFVWGTLIWFGYDLSQLI